MKDRRTAKKIEKENQVKEKKINLNRFYINSRYLSVIINTVTY